MMDGGLGVDAIELLEAIGWDGRQCSYKYMSFKKDPKVPHKDEMEV